MEARIQTYLRVLKRENIKCVTLARGHFSFKVMSVFSKLVMIFEGEYIISCCKEYADEEFHEFPGSVLGRMSIRAWMTEECAEEWRSIPEEALYRYGRLKGAVDGSALAKIGCTTMLASIKMEVVTPAKETQTKAA